MEHSTESADVSVGEVLLALAQAELAVTLLGNDPRAEQLQQLRVKLLSAKASEVLSLMFEILGAIIEIAPQLGRKRSPSHELEKGN